MADFTPTAVSKSSNFVTGSGGNKTSEIFSDLLANRTELYGLVTDVSEQFFGSTAPSNPNQGLIWRDSANGVTKRWSGTAWETDLALSLSVTIRNTVLQGNVDSGGNAALFEAGTGLACKLNATSIPLIISWMDGNDAISGEKNKIGTVSADADTFWSGLPQNSTVYLYVELSGSTIQGGYSTAAPKFQAYAPSHSAGLDWIDYNKGEVYNSNGAAWTKKYRVYVGTATTDTTSVTAINVYPYLLIGLQSGLEGMFREYHIERVFIPDGFTGLSYRNDRDKTYDYLYIDCIDKTGSADAPTSLTVSMAVNGSTQFTTSAITTTAASYNFADFNAAAGDLITFTVSNTTGVAGGVMLGVRWVRR